MRLYLLSALLLCGAVMAKNPSTPLTPSELTLGKDAVFHDGIYTVTVPKHPNPPNGTRGVVLKLDPKKVAGKAIRYRAEMRWRGIGSDTSGSHIGGKILGTHHNTAGVGRWTASPSLLGTEQEWH